MAAVLLFLVAAGLPADASRPQSQRVVPPEWPPLPDFVHPIDYVEWAMETRRLPPDQDAWPLWRELQLDDRELPEGRSTKDHLCGVLSERDWIPGLFTGTKTYEIEEYPWRPQDHPDWEKAFQLLHYGRSPSSAPGEAAHSAVAAYSCRSCG